MVCVHVSAPCLASLQVSKLGREDSQFRTSFPHCLKFPMLLLPPPPRWLVLAAKETNGILTQASLSVLHAFSAKIALSRLELRKLAQRMSHHLPHPSQRITCFFALNYWIHLRGSYRQQALGLFCPLDPDVCPNPLLGLTPPRPSPLQTVFEPSVLGKPFEIRSVYLLILHLQRKSYSILVLFSLVSL
jgi:hypothetical protein